MAKLGVLLMIFISKGYVICQGALDRFNYVFVDDLANKVRQLEVAVKELQEEINALKSKSTSTPITSVGNTGRQIGPLSLSSGSTEIGFQVSMLSTTEIPQDNKLVFDHVITDIGGAYNKVTGVFTSPLAGTYMFAASIACDDSSIIHASLMENNDSVLNILCDRKTSSAWNQGSTSAILKLSIGDKIWVKKIWPSRTSTVYGLGMTSFSGYLLHTN